ncbi:MAG TPA: hypothetical protein VKY27_06290 [Bacteriovoracaceae bacterium]|nr:hypothetical protein [Bacteriovoracaceae bacterium]
MMKSTRSTASYVFSQGTLHQGGNATIEVVDHPDLFKIRLSYSLKKKLLVPVPEKYLNGEFTLELPPQFKEETGYLKLEKMKSMDTQKAKLVHSGRRDFYEYTGAHLVHIHLYNGRGEAQILYHPSLPAAGWAEVKLMIKTELPLLENYTLMAEILS